LETADDIVEAFFVLLQQTAGKVVHEVGEEWSVFLSDRQDLVIAARSADVNGNALPSQVSNGVAFGT
jgi:hypothetical protein